MAAMVMVADLASAPPPAAGMVAMPVFSPMVALLLLLAGQHLPGGRCGRAESGGWRGDIVAKVQTKGREVSTPLLVEKKHGEKLSPTERASQPSRPLTLVRVACRA